MQGDFYWDMYSSQLAQTMISIMKIVILTWYMDQSSSDSSTKQKKDKLSALFLDNILQPTL
jgi:hypothetical protein